MQIEAHRAATSRNIVSQTNETTTSTIQLKHELFHALSRMQYREILFLVISPTLASLMVLLNAGIISIVVFFTNAAKCRKLIYILNLSIADLILGVTILMVKVMNVLERSRLNNATIKKVRIFLQIKMMPLSLYISVLSVAVITFDRLVMVFFPIRYIRIRYRTKRVVCSFIWLTSAFTVISMHVLVQNSKQEYIIAPILVLLTIFLVSVSYIQIRKHLGIQNTSLNRQRRITLSEKKFTQFCFQSFILFVVCWLPIAIYGILYVQDYLDGWIYFLDFRFTCHILAFSNSVLSPILFLVHFKRFKNKSLSDSFDANGSIATELSDNNSIKIESNL